MNKIEIKKIGSFLETDDCGFLVKKADISLVLEKWKPIIGDIIEFYKSEFISGLASIYVRGSVARGFSVDFVSDIDSFCVTESGVKINRARLKRFCEEMANKYPFCNGFEMTSCSIDALGTLTPPGRRSIWHQLIKTQSICVFGTDLSNEIEPFKIDDMVAHAYWIDEDLDYVYKKIHEPAISPTEIKSLCVWILKRIIRVGFELVMTREGRWTRDLCHCVNSFTKHYPIRGPIMSEALTLAVNPTSNRFELLRILDQFQPWLSSEVSRVLVDH